MNIGVPREATSATFENRVGLTPNGVGILAADGHRIYVQSKAGAVSGFSAEDYRAAGAETVYSVEEAWGRSDMVLKVRALIASEFPYLRDGHRITGFLHMAVAPRALIDTLLARQVSAVAYETIQLDDNSLPVVTPMSEIAGRLTSCAERPARRAARRSSPCLPQRRVALSRALCPSLTVARAS